MPRNEKFALTPAQDATARWARKAVTPFTREDSRNVRVDFVKRDGQDRTLIGKAMEVSGEGSAEHVKVMTDDGMRSANLWSVKSVSNV